MRVMDVEILINKWVIKEKRRDEIPSWIEENRKYYIFSSNGMFMEDNLTWEEAVEWYVSTSI